VCVCVVRFFVLISRAVVENVAESNGLDSSRSAVACVRGEPKPFWPEGLVQKAFAECFKSFEIFESI
jgi:hypothetical protein